jgi:hypothetical protein
LGKHGPRSYRKKSSFARKNQPFNRGGQRKRLWLAGGFYNVERRRRSGADRLSFLGFGIWNLELQKELSCKNSLTLFGRHRSKRRKLLLNIFAGADGTGHLSNNRFCHGHDYLEDLLALLALEFVNRHRPSPFCQLPPSGQLTGLSLISYLLLKVLAANDGKAREEKQEIRDKR